MKHQDDAGIHMGAYVQPDDPGPQGGLRRMWIDTSSGPPFSLFVRNEADDGWDAVGGAGGVPGNAVLAGGEAVTAGGEYVTAG